MYIIKQCTKCKEYKLLEEFNKTKLGPFGKRSDCKQCSSKRFNNYYKKNNERLKEYSKTYRKENPDKVKKFKKNLQEKKKKISLEKKDRKKNITHYKCCLCRMLKPIDSYYKQNRSNCKQCLAKINKLNRLKRKDNYLEWCRAYDKNRRKSDPVYKMRRNIRSLIYHSIKKQGYAKRSKTYKILGCDFDTFKKHIERQFTKGMTWENHGEWHYDHIIPISSAQTEEEVIKLNHYTNFQPLWAEDNLRKSDKIEPTQIKLRI
jgi:hypothetical protein